MHLAFVFRNISWKSFQVSWCRFDSFNDFSIFHGIYIPYSLSHLSTKRLWLRFLCLATTYIHFSQPACCKHLQGQHSHSCYPAAQAAINITLWLALHSDASITMKCTPGSETAVSEGMYVFTCNSCQIASLSKHKNKNKKLITYISICGV